MLRQTFRTLKEWDHIAARIVVQGQKRILAGGALAFTFEASERLIAELQEASVESPRSGQSARAVKKPPIADAGLGPDGFRLLRLSALDLHLAVAA